MKVRQGTRGFTLVELSTVVVVVAILGAVALVGYIRYVRHARIAEATQLVGSIRTEQEQYRAEKGVYYQVSTTQDAYYPAATPGKFMTSWGGPCGGCVTPNGWATLNVHPSSPVMYGYATVAGVGADLGGSSSSSSSGGGGSSGFAGNPGVVPPPSPSPSSGYCSDIGATDPYYIVKAEGDVNGDGVKAHVLGLSCSNSLIITNEGE